MSLRNLKERYVGIFMWNFDLRLLYKKLPKSHGGRGWKTFARYKCRGMNVLPLWICVNPGWGGGEIREKVLKLWIVCELWRK